MSARLLHVGSAVVDYVYRLDSLPAPGAEKTAASYRRTVGGGFNMMVAARRSGMAVAFGGQHGTGPDGDLLRAALAAEGIELLAPRSTGMDTGNSVVLVTDDAERTFVSWPGAESEVSSAMLAKIDARSGDWVFVSGYTLSYSGSRDALAGWYGRNDTMAGTWMVAGLPVDPGAIRVPTLALIPERDRIVPPASALALGAAIPGALVLRPPLGHIGMVVSAGAETGVWKPLAEWLAATG